jgi:hypothetical protein
LIIREADFSIDGEEILAGVRDFVGRMDWHAWMPEDPDELDDIVLKLLDNPAIEVTVAEHDNRIVAGAGFVVAPFYWNPEMMAAEELFWWGAPDAPALAARGVLRGAIDSVKDRYPEPVVVTMKRMETSPDAVARLYERMGLTHLEYQHIGVI